MSIPDLALGGSSGLALLQVGACISQLATAISNLSDIALAVAIVAYYGSIVVSTQCYQYGFFLAMTKADLLYVGLGVGLLTSPAIHRLCLRRCRRFPGPRIAANVERTATRPQLHSQMSCSISLRITKPPNHSANYGNCLLKPCLEDARSGNMLLPRRYRTSTTLSMRCCASNHPL